MANEARGEIAITLEGVEYGLRPSYEAIVAIETQTSKSLLQLGVAAGDGSLGHKAAAIVVTECMKAWGKAAGEAPSTEQRVAVAVNTGRVGELILEAGLLLVSKRLELLLYRAVTGGYTATGEAKATGTTMTATPAAA